MESELLTTPINKVKRQRIMETTPLVHIADEIVDEILSRLPVKSLLRFKCVCKSWLSTISDPSFLRKRDFESILLFNSKTRTVSLHSIDNDKVITESSFALVKQSKYEGKKTVVSNSCNGLVIIGFRESFSCLIHRLVTWLKF